jgi:cob(I)alamin adenosyltransferase
MKIYTKTGDSGETSLLGGERVKKFNIRLDAYGTIDELNSYIGLIRSRDIPSGMKENLVQIQSELFAIGAMLATPQDKEKLKSGKDRLGIEKIGQKNIGQLEHWIDEMNEVLPEMTNFILPGGNSVVSFCHIARTVCRRAERIIVQLHQDEPVNTDIIAYTNRLSDFLFVLARKLTFDFQLKEIPWNPK